MTNHQFETLRPVSLYVELGKGSVRVRATDGTGEVQSADRARPVPDGSTGLHAVDVTVA